MTETQEQTSPAVVEASSTDAPAANGAAASRSPKAKGGSLSSKLLPELQQIAGGLGISTAKMKKSDLVAAIQAAQSGGVSSSAARPRREPAKRTVAQSEPKATAERTEANREPKATAERTEQRDRAQGDTQRTGERPPRSQNSAQGQSRQSGGDAQGQSRGDSQNRPNQSNQSNQNQPRRDDDDEFGGSRRGRRYRDRRGRSRTTGGGPGGNEPEPTVTDDDVLVPVAGVLDAVEEKNTWFVRVEGFYASSDDVYVANSFVRKFNLRRGDAVTGMVRQPREGERREKYNPLVRLDTVNGRDPESIKNRVEFTKLTPLYPQVRLRLETEPHILTTRVIDLVMPIGKGQRALIVSPPKAGKTMVLQALANAIATNNPECHLMVVLVDERPEEVTDMQRSVKGEVIASTFDRKPLSTTPRSPSCRSSGPSDSSRWVTTSSSCSTRSPGSAGPTTSPPRRAAGSCPVVSTRPRSTRRSGSSARRAISRTAAR